MAMSGVDRMGVIEQSERRIEGLIAVAPHPGGDFHADILEVLQGRREQVESLRQQLEGAVGALEKLANPTHRPRSEEAALLQDEVAKIARAALGGMDVIWHDDAAVIDFIDAWAHDYANDAWRDLSAEDQMSEGRRIVDAATTNLRGELDRLRAQQAESLESVRQAWGEVARLRATSEE